MRINLYGTLYLSLLMIYNMISTHSQTTIECNDASRCSNQVITCEEGSDCTITCTGSDSKNCQNATFICPSGPFNCNWNCVQVSKPEQCIGAIVNASQTNFGTLSIDIFGVSAAQKSRFISPTNGDTIIKAGGYGVLKGGTVIDASHTISGNLDIEYNDADHSGLTDWKYAGMKVYCPMSGDCIIDTGVAFGACTGCEIYGQPTTSLVSVTASGGVALRGADIFCPRKSGSEKTCKITTAGSYGSTFLNMNIFAAESFTNVEISATYSGVGVPIMHCMNDYGESCDVERISNTEWQCEDTMSLCHDWAYDPTYVTSVAPTEPSTTIETTTEGIITTEEIQTSRSNEGTANLLCDDTLTWFDSHYTIAWSGYPQEGESYIFNHSLCELRVMGAPTTHYLHKAIGFSHVFSQSVNYPLNFTLRGTASGETVSFGLGFTVSSGPHYGHFTSSTDTPVTISFIWESPDATVYQKYINGDRIGDADMDQKASTIKQIGIYVKNIDTLPVGSGITFDFARLMDSRNATTSTTTLTTAPLLSSTTGLARGDESDEPQGTSDESQSDLYRKYFWIAIGVIALFCAVPFLWYILFGRNKKKWQQSQEQTQVHHSNTATPVTPVVVVNQPTNA